MLVCSVRISLLIQVSIFVFGVVAEGFCFRLYRHIRFCHFLYRSCQLFIVSLCSFPIVIFVSVTISFESFASLLEINCVEYWMCVICICNDTPSISKFGHLRLRVKSDLLKCLENLTTNPFTIPPVADAMLIAGAALVKMLKSSSWSM